MQKKDSNTDTGNLEEHVLEEGSLDGWTSLDGKTCATPSKI